MKKEQDIVNAIHQELVLSYTQSGRVVPSTVDVVATSLQNALKFSDANEVHDVFVRARDMADVPTQKVLKEAITNHRAERMPASQAITWKPAATNSEQEYIYAWWHLRGTKMAWLTDEQAQATVDAFEADPRNREAVTEQRAWEHVAAENVMRYGVSRMTSRI